VRQSKHGIDAMVITGLRSSKSPNASHSGSSLLQNMMKYDIQVQAGLHDSLSNSVSDLAWQHAGHFPLKVPNHVETSTERKLPTQASPLRVEKLELDKICRWGPPLGLKDALTSTSRCPAFSAVVLHAFCHALQVFSPGLGVCLILLFAGCVRSFAPKPLESARMLP
jgi:hypothetical protein